MRRRPRDICMSAERELRCSTIFLQSTRVERSSCASKTPTEQGIVEGAVKEILRQSAMARAFVGRRAGRGRSVRPLCAIRATRHLQKANAGPARHGACIPLLLHTAASRRGAPGPRKGQDAHGLRQALQGSFPKKKNAGCSTAVRRSWCGSRCRRAVRWYFWT